MSETLPNSEAVPVVHATRELWTQVQSCHAAKGLAGVKMVLLMAPEVEAAGVHSTSKTEHPMAATEEVARTLVGIEREVAAIRKDVGELRKRNPAAEPVSDNEAARVFALMKSLEAGGRTRKAPLERVFRLLVLEGHLQEVVAVKCQCSPGLVSLRVTEIEQRMGRPVAELRTLASQLGSMDASVEDSRARTIYRRGLTDDGGSEDEDE